MKRIALFFAAIAALSSCMKENTLSPVQPVDGQVTIKAVAADTKTLLDGTAVVWEAEDAIAVVLEGTQKNMVEFTAETVADANATFVGTVAGAEFETAYAVYPKTAFDQSTYTVSHELPATQTGVVASGMNLSSALLDADQLKSGSAEAEFHNALTLLQVVVPDGVNSVALTSSQDGLVGSTDFYVTNGVLSRKSLNTKNTVTLSTGSELAAGTYSLLVYPGNPGNLTLTMVGTDGAELIKTVSDYTFEASKYYTINLTKIFNMNVNETEYVSPAGGTFEVDVVATEEYEFSPTFTADWVSYVETKAFNGKTLVFNVEANTTGAEREANVTITWGTEGTKTFKVVQNAVFMDIVNDADGNPIQWEETFGVYTSAESAASGEGAESTYKNVFTIALSDDFSKGAYKISNMFKAETYYHNGTQSNKGGEYYANYEDGVLTVYQANAVMSYGFTSDVVLTYDPVNKTFAQKESSIKAYSYSKSRDRYIGGYSVAVKVVEKPSGSTANIAGTWNQTVAGMSSPSPSATMTITVDGSTVTLTDFVLAGTEVTATFENNQIVVPAGTMIGSGGPLDADVVLTLDGNTFTAAPFVIGGWINVSSYSATNPNMQVGGAVNPLEDFVGTWSETYVNKPYSWSSETEYEGEFTVSVVDGKLYFKNMFIFKMYSTVYTSNYYGTLSEDGKTITLEDENPDSGHGYFGPMSYAGANIVLTVDGNTLTVASAYSGQVANYVAKQK